MEAKNDKPVQCQYEDCDKPAQVFACGRDYLGKIGHPIPQWYCTMHGRLVIDEGNPEYHEHCPNCGCGFGVN